jgi:hypothetical protein
MLRRSQFPSLGGDSKDLKAEGKKLMKIAADKSFIAALALGMIYLAKEDSAYFGTDLKEALKWLKKAENLATTDDERVAARSQITQVEALIKAAEPKEREPEKPKPLLGKEEQASLQKSIDGLGLKGAVVEVKEDEIIVTRTVGDQKFSLSISVDEFDGFMYLGSITDGKGEVTPVRGPITAPGNMVGAENTLRVIKENQGVLMTTKELEDLL